MVVLINKKSSRHIRLERELSILGFHNSLRALDLVVEEMSAVNGYARHNGSDYFYHLIDVAQLILNFGFKQAEDLVTAAILHDIIEDVPGYTKKFIARDFGETVAEVVWKLSKKKGKDYKNKPEDMKEYLGIILSCWMASIIKAADRMHNFSTLRDSSLKHRKAQLENTVTYFIPFFEQCGQQYVRHESFYIYAKTLIEPIANEISRYIEDFERMEEELVELRLKCKDIG